jgi:hypothetical protein
VKLKWSKDVAFEAWNLVVLSSGKVCRLSDGRSIPPTIKPGVTCIEMPRVLSCCSIFLPAVCCPPWPARRVLRDRGFGCATEGASALTVRREPGVLSVAHSGSSSHSTHFPIPGRKIRKVPAKKQGHTMIYNVINKPC